MRHLALAAIVMLAACDRLFLSENPDAAPAIDGPPDAPPIDAPPPCFTETFTGSYDPRWTIGNPASPASITVEGGELRITLPPNVMTAKSIDVNGEDLRDGSVEVELAAAPPASPLAGCQFRVVDRVTNKYYLFATVNGQLIAQVADMPDQAATYSPTLHRWLRIRHVALTQQVVFETAPASKVWTGFRTVTAIHQVADVNAGLVAVEAAASPSPGFASFDDFVIRKPNCSSPP